MHKQQLRSTKAWLDFVYCLAIQTAHRFVLVVARSFYLCRETHASTAKGIRLSPHRVITVGYFLSLCLPTRVLNLAHSLSPNAAAEMVFTDVKYPPKHPMNSIPIPEFSAAADLDPETGDIWRKALENRTHTQTGIFRSVCSIPSAIRLHFVTQRPPLAPSPAIGSDAIPPFFHPLPFTADSLPPLDHYGRYCAVFSAGAGAAAGGDDVGARVGDQVRAQPLPRHMLGRRVGRRHGAVAGRPGL